TLRSRTACSVSLLPRGHGPLQIPFLARFLPYPHRKPARGVLSRFSCTIWRFRMTNLGFVLKLLPGSRRRKGTSVRKLTRSGLKLEPLEARDLLSANVVQTNLVSDLPGVAQFQDPNLVNPWGISESGTSPFWLSDNNAGAPPSTTPRP